MVESNHIDLRIGPLGIRIATDSRPLLRHLCAVLREYLVDDLSAPRVLRLNNEVRWASPGELAHRFDDGVEKVFDGTGRAAATVLGDFSYYDDHDARGRLGGGTSYALRLAVETWLPAARGLCLHASSIVVDECGVLVFGDSGSGKTTLAQLADTAFADECSIVYRARGGWRVTGAPFPYPFDGRRRLGSAPLAACVTPLRAPPLGLNNIAPQAAFGKLLRQVSAFPRSRATVEQVADVAARLVVQVPCYDFCFFPDRNSVDFLAERLRRDRSVRHSRRR